MSLEPPDDELPFSGERVVPGKTSLPNFWRHRRRYEFAEQFVGGRSVLDVGCGAGYGVELLARRASSVTGVDVAFEALVWGAKRYGGAYVQAAGSALPFRSGAFDIVTCFEVIEHVVDDALLVSEVARVLHDGGLAIWSTPNRSTNSGLIPWRKSLVSQFHVQEFTRQELRARLEPWFREVEFYGQVKVNRWSRKCGNTARQVKNLFRLDPLLRILRERQSPGKDPTEEALAGYAPVVKIGRTLFHDCQDLVAVCVKRTNGP